MAVTEQEVQKIASLSMLKLEGDELHRLTADFNQILDFVRTISEADTESVEPMKHIIDYQAPNRDNNINENLSPDLIKKMTPHFEAGYFVVPPVIE